MSRLVAFHYFCDNWSRAKHRPNTIEGDTVLVWSPKKEQVVEIEMCDPCLGKANHEVLTELADKYGREIEGPEGNPELACPFGCNHGKPYKSSGGKTKHMHAAHPEWEPEE